MLYNKTWFTGFYTLYQKEVQRFFKVWMQTLATPMITALLYYTVFSLSFPHDHQGENATPYIQFLAPGLMMMAMMQNAFANTSSSLIIAKVQGTIVDLLMTPLTPFQISTAMGMAALTRAVVVGLASAVILLPASGLGIASPWVMLYFLLVSGLFMGFIGLLAGIWAEKFDQIATITNFVIIPMSFLSGTFYRAESLPEPWPFIIHLNPFFYLIDGFRHGFTGHGEAPLSVGILLTATLTAFFWWLSCFLLDRGWKLRQ
ncbi:MAG: ABC transporter permease [Alphaproteobacteria bacterium]